MFRQWGLYLFETGDLVDAGLVARDRGQWEGLVDAGRELGQPFAWEDLEGGMVTGVVVGNYVRIGICVGVGGCRFGVWFRLLLLLFVVGAGLCSAVVEPRR